MKLHWLITVKVKDSQEIKHQAIEYKAIDHHALEHQKAKPPKIVENKKIIYKTCKTLQLGNKLHEFLLSFDIDKSQVNRTFSRKMLKNECHFLFLYYIVCILETLIKKSLKIPKG